MTDDIRPLIAGNWKMNGLKSSKSEFGAMVADAGSVIAKADLLVCPPATLLASFAENTRGILPADQKALALGAQDCHPGVSGAHTGDISAEMLADAGASFVIVGHSERRADHGETDAMVRQKAEAAWRAGLIAIVCIGETRAQRDLVISPLNNRAAGGSGYNRDQADRLSRRRHREGTAMVEPQYRICSVPAAPVERSY